MHVWESMSSVQFRCRWQAYIRGGSRLQNASIKSFNLTSSRPENRLIFKVEYGDENVFPNLGITLQIMLTMAVPIARCEHSFSKLKLIFSYLRAVRDGEVEGRIASLGKLHVKTGSHLAYISVLVFFCFSADCCFFALFSYDLGFQYIHPH